MWAVAEAPPAYELVVRPRAGDSSWEVQVHRDAELGRATRVTWDADDPAGPVLTVRRDDRGLVAVDPPGGQVVVLPEPDPGGRRRSGWSSTPARSRSSPPTARSC